MKEKFLKIWKETLLLGLILVLVVIGVRLGAYHFAFTKDFYDFYDTATYSYLEGYEFGKLNSFRTPVYPTFIRVVGLFGDDTTDELYARVAVAQELVSILSVFVFYLAMRKITKNKFMQSIGTLWYGCLPSIFSYNLCILTESLSISLFVVFLYTLFCYLQNKKIYQQILLAIETIILVLLRPSFLYLFIFFAILWFCSFIWDKENRKKVGVGILITVLAGTVILGYRIANQVQNGIKGLSYVDSINQADIILGMKLYGSYENDPVDEEITRIIKENIKLDVNTPWYNNTKGAILQKYDYSTLAQYNSRCIKHNWKAYSVATIRRILKIGTENVSTVLAYHQEAKRQQDIMTLTRVVFPVTFGGFYAIILLEMAFFFWNRWKKKSWTITGQMRFYTTLLLAGMLAVTLLGAQAEYQRLIAPILSAGILIGVDYLEKIGKQQEEQNCE